MGVVYLGITGVSQWIGYDSRLLQLFLMKKDVVSQNPAKSGALGDDVSA